MTPLADGIHLTILAGVGVPAPLPRPAVEALVAVEVRATTGSDSGFSVTFAVAKNSPLETLFLLAGGGVPPVLRFVFVVTLNGTPEVIMDGVMTSNEIQPGANGAPALLTIRGADLTALMDFIPFDGLPYPAMPVEARVLLILAKYAVLGLVPVVIPRVLLDVDNPLDRIESHQGTDLQYVKKLAADAGYVFYVEPGPAPLTNTAYWGPEVKVGLPQSALNVDMDADTNVDSLSFHFKNDKKTLPIVLIYNTLLKAPIPIPIPDVSLLNPPLGLIAPLPNSVEILKDTAKLNFAQAALRGLALASRSSDCVEGTGQLNVLRYGGLLKPRRLIGVRGAGTAFDGLHYVTSVTHSIKIGEYKQSFTLTRNGLASTVPQVPI